ncbi:hypothetical protein H6G51_09825 [Limnothrix sp. FACHB-708]|uniref:hypothetical protein n=1 Tax=unclassified Limnothrix TaxID=2632864 RepID=UPI0016832628|nr:MULTISPECIES: hypothetical protein [unclassified Limnothrix]MBD2553574.1 hypothetical protein [Limnothrix sp. FACHB-708]MBD2590613.1 hypothetical protein [Limnothrix sp. FACHB-406]
MAGTLMRSLRNDSGSGWRLKKFPKKMQRSDRRICQVSAAVTHLSTTLAYIVALKGEKVPAFLKNFFALSNCPAELLCPIALCITLDSH